MLSPHPQYRPGKHPQEILLNCSCVISSHLQCKSLSSLPFSMQPAVVGDQDTWILVSALASISCVSFRGYLSGPPLFSSVNWGSLDSIISKVSVDMKRLGAWISHSHLSKPLQLWIAVFCSEGPSPPSTITNIRWLDPGEQEPYWNTVSTQ